MESEAPPSAGFYNFLGWLDVNKKRVIMGAVVVALVGCIAALLIWRKGQREVEAGQALSSVRTSFNPTEPAPPGTAEAFVKVAQGYPKTAAAAQAILRAGAAFFAEGQWARAQEQFEKYLRSYGDTPWVPQATYGVAACLDAQGKTADAITKYNDFLKSYPNDPAADQGRLSLARLYDHANQPQQAIDILDKIVKGAQFSPAASEAQERLKELYAKHPNLVPAPPVPQQPAVSPLMRPNAAPGTNVVRLTNSVRSTNPPKILLQAPGQTNQGK